MSRNHHRLHGVSSILLFGVAVAIAAVVLFLVEPWAGWIYLAIVLGGLYGIITSFCTKCCCKHQCSHVVLGWIARRLPPRKVGKYTSLDIAGMTASFLAIALFPQAWIWSKPPAAIAFWLLTIVIVVEIARGVCPSCRNVLCPFHPKVKLEEL